MKDEMKIKDKMVQVGKKIDEATPFLMKRRMTRTLMRRMIVSSGTSRA